MKRYLLLLPTLLFLACFAVLSHAVPSGIDIGQGALKCESYVKKSGGKKNDYIIWVQGFFSAYNALDPATKNIAGDKDFNWIREWLDTYCKTNSGQYFGEAVRALIDELYPQRVRSAEGNTVIIKMAP
jgi:hypothetical protein